MAEEKRAVSVYQAEIMLGTLGGQYELAIRSGETKETWALRYWLMSLSQAVQRAKIEATLPTGWWEDWYSSNLKGALEEKHDGIADPVTSS